MKEDVKKGGTAMWNYRAVRSAIIVVFLLLSLAGATYAHHGIASWFDMTRSITLRGSVTGFDWTNPHVYIYLELKDAKGTTEKWSVETGSPAMLSRVGWRRDTVKPSDEITVKGKPSKEGKTAMLLEKIILANGQQLATGQELPASGDVPTPPAEGAKTPKE